jgi:hypothetical protein
MTLVKTKFDNFNSVFIKPPPLYALIKIPVFDIKQTAFFWCDHSQKLQKVKMLLDNSFVNNANKAKFLSDFSRFQKTINGFKKLVKLWRIKKKCIVYPNTTDLKGNDLSDYKPHLLIDLIEDNTIYSFCIHDLLKMWSTALRQRMIVIERPTKLKNPYTNLEFSLTNLYNIYYKALFNGIRRPPLVDMHFHCKFSIKTLLCTYGAQLREWAITDYAETEDISLYNELIGVHSDYGHLLPKLRVSDSFSDKIKMKQIQIYKPIIQAYCFMAYSNNSHLISQFNTLFFRLVEAYERQPPTTF